QVAFLEMWLHLTVEVCQLSFRCIVSYPRSGKHVEPTYFLIMFHRQGILLPVGIDISLAFGYFDDTEVYIVQVRPWYVPLVSTNINPLHDCYLLSTRTMTRITPSITHTLVPESVAPPVVPDPDGVVPLPNSPPPRK